MKKDKYYFYYLYDVYFNDNYIKTFHSKHGAKKFINDCVLNGANSNNYSIKAKEIEIN